MRFIRAPRKMCGRSFGSKMALQSSEEDWNNKD